MKPTGFERLRQEGRKGLLKVLEPYLDHTWECLMEKTSQAARKSKETGEPRISIDQFKCTCGLDEILERVRE